jgi:hypothetical protein
MTGTLKGDVLVPEVLSETVRGKFAQKDVFRNSTLVRLGILVPDGTLTAGQTEVGNEVTVPYFGTLGKFVLNDTDGSSVTPARLRQTSEKATVHRGSHAFQVSAWSRMGTRSQDDPYNEAAQQIADAAGVYMDEVSIATAAASGAPKVSVYSATVPRLMDYDLVVDSKLTQGDEAGDIVGMVVHSKTKADMLKLKSADSKPLLQLSQADGEIDRFCGVPLVESDRCPLTGSTMAAMTGLSAASDAPTLAGTPLGPWSLAIKIVAGGSRGAGTFKFSTDGAVNWSAVYTIPADGVFTLNDRLIDSAHTPVSGDNADSLVGVNGATGLTATFAAHSYTTDEVFVSTPALKVTSMLLTRNALAFYYNRQAMSLQTDKDILADAFIGAMHMYYASHRYRRVQGRTKSGVVLIEHNVTPVTAYAG